MVKKIFIFILSFVITNSFAQITEKELPDVASLIEQHTPYIVLTAKHPTLEKKKITVKKDTIINKYLDNKKLFQQTQIQQGKDKKFIILFHQSRYDFMVISYEELRVSSIRLMMNNKFMFRQGTTGTIVYYQTLQRLSANLTGGYFPDVLVDFKDGLTDIEQGNFISAIQQLIQN